MNTAFEAKARRWLPGLGLGVCLAVPVIVLAMHAAMLPQGQWRPGGDCP
jgi:hypothetical protein